MITISLDASGGDFAPLSVLKGAEIAAADKYHNIKYKIYGDREKISHIVQKSEKLSVISDIYHCESFISAEDKPAAAIRNSRGTSMRMAIEAVKNGEADAAVSSGNTGALMALSKILLGMIPGIDRPAICTLLPAKDRDITMLDLGANIECTSENLYQFALMGLAFSKVILNRDNPKIALLNIGSEEIKGRDEVRQAYQLLKEIDDQINFIGYIEGNEIVEGKADVVVTDGFSGNIALKTAEGTAKICKAYLKEELSSSLLAKIGMLFCMPALKNLYKKIDPRLKNGAMLIGLNGIVIKSHGNADEIAFANAINVAYSLALRNINQQISAEILENNYEQ